MVLAGFDPNEVDVTATPREIIVKAKDEREASGSEEDDSLRWSEFHSNDFLRRVELPGAVDAQEVAASFENGMLEIIAPKAESEESGSE